MDLARGPGHGRWRSPVARRPPPAHRRARSPRRTGARVMRREAATMNRRALLLGPLVVAAAGGGVLHVLLQRMRAGTYDPRVLPLGPDRPAEADIRSAMRTVL